MNITFNEFYANLMTADYEVDDTTKCKDCKKVACDCYEQYLESKEN